MEYQYTASGVRIYATVVRAHARLAALRDGLMKFSYLGKCIHCNTGEWYTSHADCVQCVKDRAKRNEKNRLGGNIKKNVSRRALRFAEFELKIKQLAFKNELVPFGMRVDTQQMQRVLEFARDVIAESRIFSPESLSVYVGDRPSQQALEQARQQLEQEHFSATAIQHTHAAAHDTDTSTTAPV